MDRPTVRSRSVEAKHVVPFNAKKEKEVVNFKQRTKLGQ